MPSVQYPTRKVMAAIALSGGLLLGACGGDQETGNVTEVQMQGLETVDGTINDAMTDLDGVQSEGTAMADTGNDGGATASPAKAGNNSAETDSAPEAETEVVADQ